MPFQWNEFNNVAQFLYTHGQTNRRLSEATYRCAISRSYYAAFHHLRIIGERELNKKFSTGGSGTHQQVIDYFSHHQDPIKQGAGGKLLELKLKRKKSDYVDTVTILDGDAAYSMAISQRIIQTVR